MEYRRYAHWCELNHLAPMDYGEWECGWWMRGMQNRREMGLDGPISGTEVQKDVAAHTDIFAPEQRAQETRQGSIFTQ